MVAGPPHSKRRLRERASLMDQETGTGLAGEGVEYAAGGRTWPHAPSGKGATPPPTWPPLGSPVPLKAAATIAEVPLTGLTFFELVGSERSRQHGIRFGCVGGTWFANLIACGTTAKR